MFSEKTRRRNLKTQQPLVISYLRETRAEKSNEYRGVIVSQKLPYQNVSRHRKNACVFKFLWFEERLHDG